MASGALLTSGRRELSFPWKNKELCYLDVTLEKILCGEKAKGNIWYWRGKLYLL